MHHFNSVVNHLYFVSSFNHFHDFVTSFFFDRKKNKKKGIFIYLFSILNINSLIRKILLLFTGFILVISVVISVVFSLFFITMNSNNNNNNNRNNNLFIIIIFILLLFAFLLYSFISQLLFLFIVFFIIFFILNPSSLVQWTYDFPLSQVSDDDNSMRNCIVVIVKVVVVDVLVIVVVGVDGHEEGSQPTVIHIVVHSNWWFLILNEQWIFWIEIQKISLWMNKMNKMNKMKEPNIF